jgi:hypothetical protein
MSPNCLNEISNAMLMLDGEEIGEIEESNIDYIEIEETEHMKEFANALTSDNSISIECTCENNIKSIYHLMYSKKKENTLIYLNMLEIKD